MFQEVLVTVANTLINTALNDAGVFASLGLTDRRDGPGPDSGQ